MYCGSTEEKVKNIHLLETELEEQDAREATAAAASMRAMT